MANKMSKDAYLIMAHDNVVQLNLLLSAIDSNCADIFLHIDQKSDISYADLIKLDHSELFVYKELKVYWADYSQVQCELFLLKMASQKEQYHYYHLISVADMLLKSPQVIRSELDSRNELFIHFAKSENVEYATKYVKYYHFFQKQLSIVNRGKCFSVLKVINKLILYFQMVIGLSRIEKETIIKKGANWFSLPNDAAHYVLHNVEWIEKCFKNTRSPDEFFLQTLFYNSEFRKRIYRLAEDDDYQSCLRYIDWSRGKPYVFLKADFDELTQSEMYFARKFDVNIDPVIIQMLMESK